MPDQQQPSSCIGPPATVARQVPAAGLALLPDLGAQIAAAEAELARLLPVTGSRAGPGYAGASKWRVSLRPARALPSGFPRLPQPTAPCGPAKLRPSPSKADATSSNCVGL
jgi:hypothetical protein